jgi:hypothetical protein
MQVSAPSINFKLTSVRIHLVVLVWMGDRRFLLACFALTAARVQRSNATTEVRDHTW